MATKPKTSVQLKPIINDKNEKKPTNFTRNKIQPILPINQQQQPLKPIISKASVKVKQIANRIEDKKILNPIINKNLSVPIKEQPRKPVFPKTAEFNRLITGDFTQDFSKQTSRLFRIFLSSTFSDFKVERNELYRRVFPNIKQRCAQLGYEFQVVDMR